MFFKTFLGQLIFFEKIPEWSVSCHNRTLWFYNINILRDYLEYNCWLLTLGGVYIRLYYQVTSGLAMKGQVFLKKVDTPLVWLC